MADIERYRCYIRQLLSERAQLAAEEEGIENETIFDRARDRYLLVRVGWQGETRVYEVMWHLEIVDKKVWIQQDGTKWGIASDLVELGVPAEKIVLGFDPAARASLGAGSAEADDADIAVSPSRGSRTRA